MIDAPLVHAVLRHPVSDALTRLALDAERVLLAARRRDAHAHRRRLP
jgi:hypothetical protein